MTYTGRCPHCGAAVRGGHGIPIKRIDTPLRTCHRCRHPYIDGNMYEWAILDVAHKIYFYLFANNRWLMYFLLLIVTVGGYWKVALAGLIVWVLLCIAWVNITKKAAFAKSHIRCLQPGYVDSLIKIYDKIDEKKCDHYKAEISRQATAKEDADRKAAENMRQAMLHEYNQRCPKCGKKLNALQVICDNCGERRCNV